MSEIAIIGAGAWGTALAIALGRKGTHRVRLWAHEPEVRDSINQRHSNDLFLPGHSHSGIRDRDRPLSGSGARGGDRGQRDAIASLPESV